MVKVKGLEFVILFAENLSFNHPMVKVKELYEAQSTLVDAVSTTLW